MTNDPSTGLGASSRHTTEERMERALQEIGRAQPARDLSARIIATLPRDAREPNAQTNKWFGIATLLAALLGFALAYQTAFTLRANGAFELVYNYTTQPEIVTLYPSEAWGALAAAIPWLNVGVSVVMMFVAIWLFSRWNMRAPMRAAG